MKHTSLSSAAHCKWMAPAISTTQRLIFAVPKVDKRGERVDGKDGGKWKGKRVSPAEAAGGNLLALLKTNMTGRNDSAATEAVILQMP